MRKFSFGLTAVVVAGMTTVAMAQSSYFYDVRDNAGAGQSITAPVGPFTFGQGETTGGIGNDGGGSGGRGDGQALRINPVVSNNYHIRNAYPNFDADGNKATARLWLYADVADDVSGVGDVISSIGLDIAIAAPVAARYQVASAAWTWDTTGAIVWSGTSNGTAQGPGGQLGVNDARAVKVPVSGTPAMYNTAGGLVPGGPYRIGSFNVTAASRGTGCTPATGHAAGSSYNVTNSVDSLLITRVYNGAGDADEQVQFGYFGGSLDAAVSGNTVGASSANRDAIIQVRMQGDNNGNGGVNSLDIPGFTTAQTAGTSLTQAQRYLFDNNNNGSVNSLDIPGFTAAQTAPCP
jgi:hypothetical protein